MPIIPEVANHCEVLDQKMRPLCILPNTTVLELSLPHKAVAVLATDGIRTVVGGNELAAPTAFQPLPAGFAVESFAEMLLAQFSPCTARLNFRGILRPGVETGGGWVYFYEGIYAPSTLEASLAPPFSLMANPLSVPQLLTPLFLALLNL